MASTTTSHVSLGVAPPASNRTVGTVASLGPKQVTWILRPSISTSMMRSVEVDSSVMADADEVLVDELVSGTDGSGSSVDVVDGCGPSEQAVRASTRAVATAADLGLDMSVPSGWVETDWWDGQELRAACLDWPAQA